MSKKTELKAAAARLLYNSNRSTSDYDMLIDFIDSHFDNQPTAYNLESVVGQLEAIKKDRFAWCALHNMETCEKYQAGCVDHLLDEIIKLVKAGGRDEN